MLRFVVAKTLPIHVTTLTLSSLSLEDLKACTTTNFQSNLPQCSSNGKEKVENYRKAFSRGARTRIEAC